MRKAYYIIAKTTTPQLRIMDTNVTTPNTQDSIKWTEMDSRMIRTDLAAVFHMACHNSRMYYDSFSEYTETSHFARFAIGRGSHAEEPIPEHETRVNDLTWTYYEKSSVDGKPCIMIFRYDNTDDSAPLSASKIIRLDTQDTDKIKEKLKEAIEFIRKQLFDGFDIKV